MSYSPKSVIKRKAAVDMFNILVSVLEAENKMSQETLMIVDNIILLEQAKQYLIDDIKKRGVVELFRQGEQEFYRENKSVDKLLKIVEQQRKLQAELRLTPASDKKVAGAVEPDGNKKDEFSKF